MVLELVRRLSLLGRRQKRAIVIAIDVLAMALALWAGFSTRLGILFVPDNAVVVAAALASFAIGIFGLYRLRVYHIVLRYFDLRAVTRILLGAGIAAGAWIILVYLANQRIVVSGTPIIVPRSVAFIYWCFLFFLLFVGRYTMALLVGAACRDQPESSEDQRNVVIYGANSTGLSLANAIRQAHDVQLRAFIDDDRALHGQILADVPIHSPQALPDLVRGGQVGEVLLAMQNASRSQRLAAISRLADLDIKVMTIPAAEEIVSGRFTISDVRPINVDDLLRRDSVEPLSELIRDAVERHAILITGAGGSIGSEICRQILHAGPSKLVLLDHAEFTLYEINEELIEAAAQLPEGERPEIVPIVGSMLNETLVRKIIAAHEIDTIYHAAAYKHVPLLEHNEVVAVENNVLGTLVLARAAFEAQLTRFVMISTDKAVRPKSVMGASKRFAELIVQALADLPECRTRFGIVRFGNVLDSSGSVVQRFRRQISAGGPVTVTHEEIVRFFMSIPEATQLVLQASAMARNGEVFVLDMGEPVKIADLARHMITLSGLTVRDGRNPHGDVAIEFIGLRPGEKLFEELFVGTDTLETSHPRILMAKERSVDMRELDGHIDDLKSAISLGSNAAVRQVLDSVLRPDGAATDEDKVTSIAEWRR